MQARRRKHASLPPAPARLTRIEHEYERKGATVYLAAWDVRCPKIFGRCAPRNGIQPFDGLIAEVMDQEPYRSAKRVFRIIDNCSVHRGQKRVQRLQARWPSIVPVHTPNHPGAKTTNRHAGEGRTMRILSQRLSAATPQQKTSDESSIRTAVSDYIEGYYTGDAIRMEKSLHPHYLKHTISDSDGRLRMTETTGLQIL